jgi:uncharacterized protein YciI
MNHICAYDTKNELMGLQQFISILTPTRIGMLTDGPTEFEEKTVSSHFEYLEALVKKGVVLLAGRTLTEDEKTFGVVIFLAKDMDDARLITANDPVIINRVMQAEVLPFRIALPQNE